jgi:hypothetical protein
LVESIVFAVQGRAGGSVMSRYVALILVGLAAGCAGSPRSAHEECRVEAGWLDSTNGCSEHEGYPDCWKVCADGTRVRVGAPNAPVGAAH